jgi:hypothetical protein
LTGLTALPVAALLLLINPLQAAAAPPGNNGTIKVDKVVFDSAPNNEPHVGCSFQIDFYGFDQGTAKVTFVAQAPTGKDGAPLLSDTVTWGTDQRGGSEAGLNADRTYSLADALAKAGYTPHPKQGYHVKLTINAPGAQGADTKHKVFWVKGCDTTSGENTDNTVTHTGNPDSTTAGTPAVENKVLGESLTKPDATNPAAAQPGTTVLGTTLTKPDGTAPVAALATTGAPIGMSLLLAAIALTLGSVALYFGKRKSSFSQG